MPYCCHDAFAELVHPVGSPAAFGIVMTDHIDFAATRAGRKDLAVLARTLPLLACLSLVLPACTTTTSGSQRLDETGKQMADNGITLDNPDDTPATSVQVIAALRGGLVARM